MNFSCDRDLLLMEPNLFNEVAFLSQPCLRVTDGILAGVTLRSASADFQAAQVEAGGVVLLGAAGQPRVAHEIVGRPDAHTLTISLPRTAVGDPPIPSTDGTELEICVRTFAPQAALIHDLLMQMLELDPQDTRPGHGEDAIVSLSAMNRLEVLGTLERVYEAAAGLLPQTDALRAKARAYHDRFAAGLRRATILLDLDGDGYADARRQLDVLRLVRA